MDISLKKTDFHKDFASVSSDLLALQPIMTCCWPHEPSQQHMSGFSSMTTCTTAWELHSYMNIGYFTQITCDASHHVHLILIKPCLLLLKFWTFNTVDCYLFEVKKCLQHFMKRSNFKIKKSEELKNALLNWPRYLLRLAALNKEMLVWKQQRA